MHETRETTSVDGGITGLRGGWVCAALVVVSCTFGLAGEARAADWMFRQSYFSHHLPPEVAAHYPQPPSRSAYRSAIAGTTPGLSIRGAYRFNRIFLGSGGATDLTIHRQDWFELQP